MTPPTYADRRRRATVRRILGDAYFFTKAHAEAAGAKLRKAGFGFHITADPPDPDPEPGDSNGPFAVFWRDEETTDTVEQACKRFFSDIDALFPNYIGMEGMGEVGPVPLGFVPTRLYVNGRHFRYELLSNHAH